MSRAGRNNRGRTQRLRNRIANASAAFQTCTTPGCSRPTAQASGVGLHATLCTYHRQMHARHGSALALSYRATELAPYLTAALKHLKANRHDPLVAAALSCLSGLLLAGGHLQTEMDLRGRPARFRCRAAFARLREAGVPPERLLGIHLGMAALIEDNRVTEERHSTQFDYSDTSDTRRWRKEMDAINTHLAHARLALLGDQTGIDLGNRALRRAFITDAQGTERWDAGGRLWGGFWQTLPKQHRDRIRIEAQRVADLDFKNLHLRLAYIEADLKPPEEDLYAGIVPDDLEGCYRPGVKKCVNALLSRTGPLTRPPMDAAGLLPEGWTGKRIRAAILARHPLIAGQFECGAGGGFMRAESDIMVDVLLTLNREGITALPMHDGLMVARRHAVRAAEVMGDAAERRVGFKLPTESKVL